eukprot:CAMPEP_0185586906 /NCGR_PEP_ID=MMETSP0434-20130131/46618_1 /TAXON_ID=626734 ORGANISM="Favella taraikaensis, Strain Fe Narragansett Bay" /NCGR_SAMPLE_ID=MMETSP0434 /ASSEMBLY_ACC=CAM_ASM_000379 /LENGTH=98 /DNA_ID=CAMNT_0028208373 /DNA_START=122 /DNA_END=415 /DNA_ORIENTATION=+
MGMRHIHIEDVPPVTTNAMPFQNAAEMNNVAISLHGEFGASPNIAKSTENDQDKISATDDQKDNSPNTAKSTENDQDKISATDDENDNGGSFESGSVT